MHLIYDTIPLKIQTHRGDLDIQEILPSDKVYCYFTGEELEVREVIQFPKDDVYSVNYSDGREAVYKYNEAVHIGENRNVILHKLFPHNGSGLKDNPLLNILGYKGSIIQHPMTYDAVVKEPLRPDPYVAGALLIYGEYDIPFVNLPFYRRYDHPHINELVDRLGAGTQLGFKYQLHPVEDTRSNVLGFRDSRIGSFVTWMDFFDITMKEFKEMQAYKIFDVYRRGSINDRWQFIRGVFDTGYDERDFPDDLSVGHKYESRLRMVQKVLWSIGVLSHIRRDGSLKREREYRLDVLTHRDQHNMFFYQGKFYPNHPVNIRDPEFRLQLRTARWKSHAVSFGLSLGKPGRVYITSDFLPRVSL